MNRPPRTRVLARLSGRDDAGNAMVMVLAAMLLTSMMVTVIVATSVFTIRNTQATRANVQAVSAAEAGAQTVARGLMLTPADRAAAGFTCAGTYESPGYGTAGATAPQYRVVVEHKKAGQSVWSGGCPTDTADALRIRSTGLAADQGVGGVSRGDESVTEILFERPNPQPRFNKAIFGDLRMGIDTGIDITTVNPAQSPDMFTNGDFTCSTQTSTAGSLYVKGNAVLSSSPCTVKGDVYVEGNLTCSAGTTIGGALYVRGNASFNGPCNVAGELWVGGYLNNTHGGVTSVGGNFTVRGNVDFNPAVQVGGSVRVGGSMKFTWSGPRADFFAAHPTATENDASVGLPPAIPASPDNAFPKILEDGRTGVVGTPGYSSSSLWTGWGHADWRTTVAGASGDIYANPCSPWGAPFTTPIKVMSNTVFDARSSCGDITLTPGTKIELYADAVILANKIGVGSGSSPVRVTSGDGRPHSIYLIVPWPAGQATCSNSWDSAVTITGQWQQDNLTSAMFYSPRQLTVNGSPSIRGQLYGCTLNAATKFSLNYVPVGDAGGATPDLTALRLQYMRDVTD